MLVEALWLVHNGIELDAALSLSDVYRTAFAIVFSEINGNKFDWDAWGWQEQK